MEQERSRKSLTKVRDGIQVFKMGSRLEYYISSDPNSNSGLMLEKESKTEEIAQRAISSRQFCFSLFI
jgi:hypothetical protein